MYYTYEAIFTKEKDGGYSVDFPDLKGCYTCGDDYKDAVDMAADVLAFTLSNAEADGVVITAPSFHHDVTEGQERVVVAVNTSGYPAEVTTTQAASFLGVTQGRVRQMIAEGLLDARKSGRDHLVSYVSLKSVERNPRKAGRPKRELAAA